MALSTQLRLDPSMRPVKNPITPGFILFCLGRGKLVLDGRQDFFKHRLNLLAKGSAQEKMVDQDDANDRNNGVAIPVKIFLEISEHVAPWGWF